MVTELRIVHVCLNSRRHMEEWTQAFSAIISGIVWMGKS